MHHSRLSSFVIDCQGKDIEAAARFWSGALGRKVRADDAFPTYRELAAREQECILLVINPQRAPLAGKPGINQWVDKG